MVRQELAVHLKLERVLACAQRSGLVYPTVQRLPDPLAWFGASHGRGVGDQVLPVDKRLLVHDQSGVEANEWKVGNSRCGGCRCFVSDRNVHAMLLMDTFIMDQLCPRGIVNRNGDPLCE